MDRLIANIEVSNWFTSTHPGSPFVTGLLVATIREDGAFVSLSDWGDERGRVALAGD
jgi:arylamine N-acetyltransferase